jgi:hypothetical protein
LEFVERRVQIGSMAHEESMKQGITVSGRIILNPEARVPRVFAGDTHSDALGSRDYSPCSARFLNRILN